jgi:energy-coupling factor transporter ATP-binding protein EcfA2
VTDPSNSNIQVYFAGTISVAQPIDTPSILIAPTKDRWNDFGLRTLCEFRLLQPGSDPLTGQFRLAFLANTEAGSPRSTPEVISSFLGQTPMIQAEELPPFFSILTDLATYRHVVRQLNIQISRTFLLAVHDLVATQVYLPKAPWLGSAIESEAFGQSFMRNSDTAFAYYNAAPILDGLEYESLETISQQYKIEFQLATFSAPHSLNVTFNRNSLLPKRIAAFIGRNGAGKSQALRAIAVSLLSDPTKLHAENNGRPLVNRLIAIGTPAETHRTFPNPPRRPRIPYYRFALQRSFRRHGAYGLGGLLVQLARSIQIIANTTRWSHFCRAIGQILPLESIVLPSKKTSDPDVLSYVPILALENVGEQRRLINHQRVDPKQDLCRLVDDKLVPLSSGQTSFVAFAAQLCLMVENGSLVLIDEPETHLHPHLISQLVILLDDILLHTGSVAIIATHAVHLIRELPASQVHVFRETEVGVPEILNPRLKTFAADLSSISSFVFGDHASEQLALLKRRLDSAQSIDPAATIDLAEELPSEAFMELTRPANPAAEE